MSIRKILKTILLLALIITGITGCVPNNKDEKTQLFKIGEFIYEITYTGDFDWSKVYIPDLSEYACSGVQNGQYRGRNYDWVYSENGICVVHANVNDSRPHASVGVADLSFIPDIFETYDLSNIPFIVVDGINDAGVCIQANIMPSNENGEIIHSNSEDDDLIGVAVVRYILDYADSIEDSIALLQNKDIYPEVSEESDIHWMISGPKSKTDKTIKTIIVEVFPDGLHITEDFVDDKPIMTNFNISNFDGSLESTGIGFGYERWQILNEYYEQADSVMGTFDLMEKVYYSKLYDLYSDKFWYTEYNGIDLAYLYEPEELKVLIGEDIYDYYMENYGGVYYNQTLYDGEERLKGDIEKAGILSPVVALANEYYKTQNIEEAGLWITVHTSVYDLINKTLDIQVHESHDHLHFTIE